MTFNFNYIILFMYMFIYTFYILYISLMKNYESIISKTIFNWIVEKKAIYKDSKEFNLLLSKKSIQNDFDKLKDYQQQVFILQKQIENLASQKINWLESEKNKFWLELDLSEKTIYESVYSYFINKILVDKKLIKFEYIDKKIKYNCLSKKESLQLDIESESNVFMKHSNFLENINNKIILSYIDKKLVDKLYRILDSKENIKKEYLYFRKFLKRKLEKNKISKNTYNKYKKLFYTSYQKSINNINNKIKTIVRNNCKVLEYLID